MQFPLHVERFGELAGLTGELHLAIGMFDGVHPGHRSVICPAVVSARENGGLSCVLTFDPHPSHLFSPENPTRLIMPVGSKYRLLDSLGVDVTISKKFNTEFASIPAESFLTHLGKVLPCLHAVYVGENFRFGKNRAGSVDTLIESGNQLGIKVFSAERIRHNGEPISSTRIRRELEAGRIEEANSLLGYKYTSSGTVVGGKRLGRTIGFPTLNIPWAPACRPAYGVYHVRFHSSSETTPVYGVANYGMRPTVNQSDPEPLLEVHALTGTTADQGDLVEVEWLHFIRPEQKFESIELLKAQIYRDCEVACKLRDAVLSAPDSGNGQSDY